ncbi:hypothetical protein Pla175_45040 [Pirellulimonas nuda]|uniref:Inverse autotransporter beta-domain domain-containing protein n=1 Tax=Pirellulimonas nuda TaxID=2528009 RepID=A0A518DHY6_9BACT|nr:hypothetical protein [Pirellulimonas nuda]QDU91086.1 hypothetical protein Pla175_45040 [Pirellulimonas nuda]
MTLLRLATLVVLFTIWCGAAGAQQLSLPPEEGSFLDGLPPEPNAPLGAQAPAGNSPYQIVPDVVDQSPYFAPAEGDGHEVPPPTAFSVDPTRGFFLRARYTTEGYGQPGGSLDLGTMRLFPIEDDAMLFVDGQIVLNEESHVGYNAGIGYRFLTLPVLPVGPDDAKVMGVSIWSDGTSTQNGRFISQIGTSLEYLGDTFDIRANGYAPLLDQALESDFSPTGEIDFVGNNLSQLTTGIRETALSVGEIELARRVRDRDFWLIGGAYGMAGEGLDSAGYKLGARGYVTPDLLLQLVVTDDELFDTNTVFTATWMIGRTRDNWRPTCTVLDRMREPVMRNNYVAVYEESVAGAQALTDAATGEELRFVHVDSAAAPGGDGTVERPLASLSSVQANSQANDRVLAYADSTFTNQTATLQDGQQLLGESSTSAYTINTTQLGAIPLPRASTGTATPIVNGPAAGSGVVLADTNTVENLVFNSGQTAINGAAGAGNPTLRNLTIRNQTQHAIDLAPLVRDPGTANETVAFTTNIATMTFENNQNDIHIDAADTAAAGATRNKNVTISGVTTTNVVGDSIFVENTTAGSTLSVATLTYNGGTTGDSAVRLSNNAGATTLTSGTLTGGQTSGRGVYIQGGTGAVTAASGFQVTGDVGAAALEVNGGSAAVTYNGTIANHNGTAAWIVTDSTGAVTLAGNVSNLTGDGARITNATNVAVNGDVNGSGVGQAVVASYTTAGDHKLRMNGVDSTGGVLVSKGSTVTGGLDVGIRNSTFDSTVIVDAQNSGAFDLQMQGVTIDATGTDRAMLLNVGTNVTGGDVLISGANLFNATNASALQADITGANVQFQMTGAILMNSSGNTTANINSATDANLQLTLTNNVFNNTGGGVEFQATSSGTSTLFANLNGNDASGGGFDLTENAGSTFRITNLTTLSTRNSNETFTFNPAEINFTDAGAATPTLPTVPAF